MEKDKMPYSTNTTPTPQTLPYTTMSKTGHSADPWHSTPKQKQIYKSSEGKPSSASQLNFGNTAITNTATPSTAHSCHTPTGIHAPVSGGKRVQKPLADIESMTIQKQRKELQLLIAELKDRDKELNNMVLAHQKQLVAWEVDRQRVLTLEQRCARLESELHNRNDIIRALTKKIKILEAQQKDRESALTSTQEQLQEIFHRELEASSHCQDLAEKNQSLSSSVVELSSHVGQMQAREQELAAMLKLKDKDMMEATDHIIDLTTRFKKLETAQRDGKLGEVKAKKETQEIKQRLREVKHEMGKLKDDLREKTGENNSQREDLIRLKQENQHLHNELALAGERERRKDELLELAKSKKERTETELYCLRQVCENQQNDLQLLHLNLESSQERLQEQEERIHSSGGDSPPTAPRSRSYSKSKDAGREEPEKSAQLFPKKKVSSDTFDAIDEFAKRNESAGPSYFSTPTTEDRGAARNAGLFPRASCTVPTNSDASCSGEMVQNEDLIEGSSRSEPKIASSELKDSAIAELEGSSLNRFPFQSTGLEAVHQDEVKQESFKCNRYVDTRTVQWAGSPVRLARERRKNNSIIKACSGICFCKGKVEHSCSLGSKEAVPSDVACKDQINAARLAYQRPDRAVGCTTDSSIALRNTRASIGGDECDPTVSDAEWVGIFKADAGVDESWWLSCDAGQGVTSASGHSREGRLDFSSLGLDSPMVSAFPSPIRRGQGQRGSSVIGNDCLRSEDPPVTVTANGERRLKSAVDNEEPCSPTSRLQRLLAESKQMVANLERATLQPVSTARSHNSSESSRDSDSRARSSASDSLLNLET